MRPEDAQRNPFVGPVPFGPEDADLFFGRGGEVQELVSLVVANRIVVLYAASGAGKTSLLNAGVVPVLERRERFEVLPAARFSRVAADDDEARNADNVYAYTTLLSWREPDEPAAHTTLPAFLDGRDKRHDARGRRLPRVVVFDQFEEIFTVHPEHWEQREGFFEQLAAALDDDRHLHLVLTLREDYLAQLEPLLPVLLAPRTEGEEQMPVARSHVRYRLERLGRDAAIEAVTGPVEKAGRRFSRGVAEELVEDLQKLRVDVGGDQPLETPGEFVEPVQLQVVCHSLWNDLPREVDEITREHIQAFGDVDDVLERFYDEAVSAAAKPAGVDEERLRRWVQEAFITSLGTRNAIYRAVDSRTRFPDAAIDELENRHLIRGEWRLGTRWYELTHDRFIAPIQSSNARAEAEARRRRRKRTRRIAAVVVPLAAVGLAWGASTRSQPAVVEAVGLVSEARAMGLNVPYESYLQRVGQPPTELHPPRRLGNVISLRVKTEGLRGKPVLVSARTAGTSLRERGQMATITLTPQFDEQTSELDLWIPLPRTRGRFRYIVSLEERETQTRLSDLQTEFFRVRAEGPSLLATGDRPVFTLQVRKGGEGAGQVVSFPTGIECGRVCSSQYDGSTDLSLVAKPRSGSLFAGWRGDCRGRGACVVTVVRNLRVVAEFIPDPHDVVETDDDQGVLYSRSPSFGSLPGAREGARVRIFCYTKGRPAHSDEGGSLRESDDWAKVATNPDRYAAAVWLRRSRDGRIPGIPDC